MEEKNFYRLWYKDDQGVNRERIIEFIKETSFTIVYYNLKNNRKVEECIHKNMFTRSEKITENQKDVLINQIR